MAELRPRGTNATKALNPRIAVPDCHPVSSKSTSVTILSGNSQLAYASGAAASVATQIGIESAARAQSSLETEYESRHATGSGGDYHHASDKYAGCLHTFANIQASSFHARQRNTARTTFQLPRGLSSHSKRHSNSQRTSDGTCPRTTPQTRKPLRETKH